MAKDREFSEGLEQAFREELHEIWLNFGGLAEESSIEACKSALFSYLRSLIEVNEQINLTAIRDFEEGVRFHLFDSIQLCHVRELGSVVDWGSGGGFPGVPLFLCRYFFLPNDGVGERVVVLDSKRKKVSAVEAIFETIGLDRSPEYSWGRGEEVLSQLRVDSVVMRAVAPIEKLLKWVSHDARNWIFFASSEQEVSWAENAGKLKNKGFHLSVEHSYRLPGHESERFIIKLTNQKA